MKASEVKVGSCHLAKIRGIRTVVQVTRVDRIDIGGLQRRTVFRVIDREGREHTFRTAGRFWQQVASLDACPDSVALSFQERQQPRTGYTCRWCGQHHVSDDTELWCMVAARQESAPAGLEPAAAIR